MTTVEAIMSVWNWLLADWTHPIVACSAIAALTPTPAPGTFAAKMYKAIDIVAINVLHAKSTGITPAALAEQVAVKLIQAKAAQIEVPQPEKQQ